MPSRRRASQGREKVDGGGSSVRPQPNRSRGARRVGGDVCARPRRGHRRRGARPRASRARAPGRRTSATRTPAGTWAFRWPLGDLAGPILSSYTLVTEISFYVFLPLYAFLISRLAHGTAARLVRLELCAFGILFAAGFAYRYLVCTSFEGARAGQLLNILPGWIDVFAVGIALAVVSAWMLIGRRRCSSAGGSFPPCPGHSPPPHSSRSRS